MNTKKIKERLSTSEFGKFIWRLGKNVYRFFCFTILPDKYVATKQFEGAFGRKPNFRVPVTLNEKLMWMKLYDRERWHSFYADKYAVREYLGQTFGKEYLVPLLFETTDVSMVRPENIPEFPCIIKSNHAMAQWQIVRTPESINWKSLRRDCKDWIRHNWYNYSKEYQYKYIQPRIIVEKLLETKEGKIPNDYKLHFLNGKLAFVYVSFDREGANDRVIYDPEWNKLPFSWVPAITYFNGMGSSDVPKPSTFDDMVRIGTEIAKKFPRYIRVDFYDVDGKLYFGEITFHHGGAMDKFFPEEYDEIYGRMLTL